MAKNMSWFQARILAYNPALRRPIRREAWRRWLVRGVALWKTSLLNEDGSHELHVARMGVMGGVASEFTKADFLALDWTDEVWVVAGLPGTYPPGSSGTPATTPQVPGGGGSSPGSSGGAGAWTPVAGRGQGGGGGGGGGSPSNGGPTPETSPAGAPSIGVQIFPVSLPGVRAEFTPSACYYGGFAIGDPPRSTFVVEVSIAGGPTGLGTMSVTFNGSTQLGTAWRGMNRGHEFLDVGAVPGGALTAEVSYTNGGDTFTGNRTFTFPPWCSGTCALPPAVFDLQVSGIPIPDGGDDPNVTIETDWFGEFWRYAGTIPDTEDPENTFNFTVTCLAGVYEVTVSVGSGPGGGTTIFHGYGHPGSAISNTVGSGSISLNMLPDGRG